MLLLSFRGNIVRGIDVELCTYHLGRSIKEAKSHLQNSGGKLDVVAVVAVESVDEAHWINSRVARFFMVNDTQTGKMCQMDTKCTKWSYNIPNVCKIFQMAIKYMNNFQYKALQNFPKLGFWV
jgi:hypothetical protein